MEDFFIDIFKTQPYPVELAQEDRAAKGTAVKPFPFSPSATEVVVDAENMPTTTYQPLKSAVKRTLSHNLGAGDVVELNSIKYKIIGILSEEGKTAEAVIYEVKDEKDRRFALKLYYEFNDAHLEPNSDTLQRIREIGGTDILFLYDFGTGPNKHLGRYCFEIMEYAGGGDLTSIKIFEEKYTPEFIEKNVIPSIHNGLKSLHKNKIYHCDLKPQNVFFLDQNQTKLVIGDYGSAKSFEKSSEKELSYTTIIKGTEFYLAPEQSFGIVSEKNDYYSLGMIILHLLYPKQVTLQNLRRIFERRTKALPIIDFNNDYARLNKLIEGLTLQDYSSRWGCKEVSAWLEGNDVAVNYGFLAETQVLRIGNTEVKSGKDLADYIAAGNYFYDVLIEDKEAYNLLLAWIESHQGAENKKLFEVMVSYYKRYFGIEYVKEAMLFFFDPIHQISIGSEKYDFNQTSNLKENSATFFSHMDELWKISDFETLRVYFFRFEFALRRLRVKSDNEIKSFIDLTLSNLAEIIQTNYQQDFSKLTADLFIQLKNEHLPGIFYYFNKARKFRDLQQREYSTWFEVCEYLKNHPSKGEMDFLQLEKSAFLMRSTKEEFNEFIEFSDDISTFLLKHDYDFELLTLILNKFSHRAQPLKLTSDILTYYRKSKPEILREVLLRLVTPELPIDLMGFKIHLYRQGNFQNMVQDFFAELDRIWKSTSFEEMVHFFFSFEFSLLQIINDEKPAVKNLVEPLQAKINKVIEAKPHDAAKLHATWYKNLSDEKFLELFYTISPKRTFCTHEGASIKNTEEIAFYYIQNPEFFEEPRSVIEREFYLRKTGNRVLVKLDYKAFILKIFQSQTTIEADIKEILFDEPAVNELTVYYDYSISLTDFLGSKGIHKPFNITGELTQQLIFTKKPFDSDAALYDNFLEHVERKHASAKLAEKSRHSFYEALEKNKKTDFIESFALIPRYLLYLFPAFGMIYFSMSYLLDNSIFKQISYNLSPTLNFVAIRLATSNFATLLFAAYFLNLLVSIFLLIPLLSLQRKKDRFENFLTHHGSLINRFTRTIIFAPIIFIGLYFLFAGIFGEFIIQSSQTGIHLQTVTFSIILYIIFIVYQMMTIITALFKASKKIRVLPLLITLAVYVSLGYWIFSYHNIL